VTRLPEVVVIIMVFISVSSSLDSTREMCPKCCQ
jgi:hypothetical protein